MMTGNTQVHVVLLPHFSGYASSRKKLVALAGKGKLGRNSLI